jgi:hypothetical protein
VPVTGVAYVPQVIVVNPGRIKATTLKELIALAGEHGVKPKEKKEAERPIWDILLGTP